MMIKISHIILGLLIFFTDSGIRLVHHVCDICAREDTEIHIFTSSHDSHGDNFADCLCHDFSKSFSNHDHHKDCNEKILKNNSKYLVERTRTISSIFVSFTPDYSGFDLNNRISRDKQFCYVPFSEAVSKKNLIPFLCRFLC